MLVRYINIPPAPFKGGDVMVNIHEYYMCMDVKFNFYYKLSVVVKNGRTSRKCLKLKNN